MRRNYKRKTEDKYIKEVLDEALARIQCVSMSRTMRIPEQTWGNCLKRISPVAGELISEGIENDLAENIVFLSGS